LIRGELGLWPVMVMACRGLRSLFVEFVVSRTNLEHYPYAKTPMPQQSEVLKTQGEFGTSTIAHRVIWILGLGKPAVGASVEMIFTSLFARVYLLFRSFWRQCR